MFAGIGGFRTGLTNAGDFFMPVGWCEKDKHAQKAYRLLYGTEGEYFCDDARIINPADLPDFDLICGGFPCQPFSVAGQRLGFADERGTLFHEICALRKQSYWHEAPGTLNIFCLRTCRGYSLTKGGKLSSLSSPRLGNWGILLNGVLLTAQTSASPKIGSECTLSDILIADCPAKYILSEKAHIQILSSLFPDAKVSVYIPPMEPPYV